MVPDVPLVSVVIPTFNAGRFVTATIESALLQTVENIEVIVVDDGSTDDTVARVQMFHDTRLRLVRNAHRGAPVVLNIGLHLAQGRYIAFLDHDDLWLPGKLERHTAFLAQNPQTAVTFSWSSLIDEHGRPIRVRPAHWHGPITFRDLLRDYVVGASSSLVMSRCSVVEAGGFDEHLPLCHDMDLILRLVFARCGISAIPETLTLYRRHSGQMSQDWRAMRRDWYAVLHKCRQLAPADTAAVELHARSNMNRYLACLAYEDGEFRSARTLMLESLRSSPRGLVGDRRNWRILAACSAEAALPVSWHRRLERLVGIHRD